MKRPLILAGCLCAFLAGCHDRPASTGRMGESLYTMQERPHKLFSLDDSTTQVLSYIQTYEDGGRQRLALFNEPFADICIFDVETGKDHGVFLGDGEGYVASMYKKYGKIISPMGCRAFLSPWYERGGMHPADEKDEPVFVGRFNIGAVSLHLPMILAKARQEGAPQEPQRRPGSCSSRAWILRIFSMATRRSGSSWKVG